MICKNNKILIRLVDLLPNIVLPLPDFPIFLWVVILSGMSCLLLMNQYNESFLMRVN